MSSSWKLVTLVLMLVLFEACGGNIPKRRAPGELGSVPARDVGMAQISPQGDILYYTYGQTAYSVDVADPRHPRILGTDASASALLCNGEAGCDGFLISGSYAYFADSYNLAKVALPNAGYAAWLYGLPSVPPDHYTTGLVPLPNGGLAIGGLRQNTVDTVPGDLLLLSMSNGLPSLSATVTDTSSTLGFLSSDGPLLFYLAASNLIGATPPAPYHRVVVVDAADIRAPFEVARIDIPGLPVGDDAYFFQVAGRDLLVGAMRQAPKQFLWIAWYRFSPQFDSLEFLDAVSRWYPANPPFVLSGGRLFLGVSGSDAEPFDLSAPNRLVVLRLDPEMGLVEESITPLNFFTVQFAFE